MKIMCANSFFKNFSSSAQSTFGVTSQVKENHSQRDLHWWTGGERSGLAVGRSRRGQREERKGNVPARNVEPITVCKCLSPASQNL